MTDLDIPPERVLKGAIESDLQSVVVVGQEKDGKLYIASSDSDLRHNGWLLDLAKRFLLKESTE